MADKFQLKAIIMGVDRLSPVLSGMRKNVMGFRRQLLNSGLGKPISIQDIVRGGALAAPFIAGTKAAIDFESSMADVRKVVDFETPKQFDEMGQDILQMSKRLPMAARDIAAIVAAGGQSGLARQELGRFAEDAVKMGIAFDQTAEESGDMMAKWRTSFRIGQDEVVALADKINYLSNNGAATAQQISAIVTRIGPLGEVAGLAAGEIAAMGSTLAGIGVSEEQASTGLKNFMLAMTSGSAATKTQRQVFKALRLDAAKVAADMQQDAKGAMLRVLTAISKVDASKQAGVLQQLFGKESITAIAPMLTNLELLKKNFAMVADETAYSGSMLAEYEARAKTRANTIQLLKNRVSALGVTIGNVLLPAIDMAAIAAGPMLDVVTTLAQANPWLIKGIVGAAGAFVALRLAVVGVAMATKLLSATMSMSPLGLIVRGLALAAGFLMANWSAVAPYFQRLWARMEGPVRTVGGWLRTLFDWSPLGLIIQNWGSISAWFSDLWSRIQAPAQALFSWYRNVFFNWTPLGLIVQNWQPIVDWFRSAWERIMGFVEPVVNAASRVRDAVGDGVSGAWSWVKDAVGVGSTGDAARHARASGVPAAGPSAAVPAAFAPAPAPAAAPLGRGQTQLDGELVVRFENTPPGTRVEPMRTNQPGMRVRQNVGYRTLAGVKE